jgi:hypothetical protein
VIACKHFNVFWNLAKISCSKRPVCHKPPLKRENGTWAKENKEKAELFAEHTFTPNTNGEVEDELDEVINEETGIIPRLTKRS